LNYTAIAEGLSLCNPDVPALLALAATLMPGQFGVLANYSSLLGPCGAMCREAVCGLDILCPTEGASVIAIIKKKTCSGVPALSCVSTGTNITGATVTSTPQSTPLTAAAGSCAALSGTSCARCTIDRSDCTWCDGMNACIPRGAGALGPKGDVYADFFDCCTSCTDWRYGQCWVSGRTAIIAPVASAAILLCATCCGVAVCCWCRAKKRRARVGYKVHHDAETDDVSLLAHADDEDKAQN